MGSIPSTGEKKMNTALGRIQNVILTVVLELLCRKWTKELYHTTHNPEQLISLSMERREL
jgi:hypothetical protein